MVSAAGLVLALLVLVASAETGHVVVYRILVMVVTPPTVQSWTCAGQEVMVLVKVVLTVDVVRCTEVCWP